MFSLLSQSSRIGTHERSRKTVLLILLGVLVAFASGCGKNEEVNVSAQFHALKTGDRDTRYNACVDLARAGPGAASAVPDLLPLLKDPDAEIRRVAAYALTEIGPKARAAIPALKELLKDRDPFVAVQALNALRSIDPKSKDD